MSDLLEVAPGVACLPILFVNVYFVGAPGALWVLVDTGIAGKAGEIKDAAEMRYGAGAKPEAIVLTHGHLDHAGSARELADTWDAPIYAHPLEMPYLTGKSLYPPNDPTVGGALAFLTRALPPNGFDLGDRMHELPSDGQLPFMPGWEWHATPGHSPGHVSLLRVSDKTLLVGDAFATMNLDSPIALLTKKSQLSVPPAAITCDWDAARDSVRRLAGLRPFTVAAGHGLPLVGADVADHLATFSAGFTPPPHGRYIPDPAITDQNGIVSLPPPPPDPFPKQVATALGIAALAGMAAALVMKQRKNNSKD